MVDRCMRSTTASMRVGSWPRSSGARLSSITLHTARGAPYPNASPRPVRPSSVCTRTTICLREPAVQLDGGVIGFIGMASGMAWMAVIFMRLASRSVRSRPVIDGLGGAGPLHAKPVQALVAHAGEELGPRADAEDPLLEPPAVALRGARFLVVAVIEVVVASVVALDGRRIGAERLQDDGRHLERRRQHEIGIAQHALSRADLL